MQKLLGEYSIGIPCLFQLSQLGLSLTALVSVINRIQAIAVDIRNEVLLFSACSHSCLGFPVKLSDTFVMGGISVPRQNIPIVSTTISYRFGVLALLNTTYSQRSTSWFPNAVSTASGFFDGECHSTVNPERPASGNRSRSLRWISMSLIKLSVLNS